MFLKQMYWFSFAHNNICIFTKIMCCHHIVIQKYENRNFNYKYMQEIISCS